MPGTAPLGGLGTPRSRWPDGRLLLALWAAALALLGVLLPPLLAGRGRALAVLPWVAPAAESVALMVALGLAGFCLGRARLLDEPPVLWAGLAFWAYVLLGALDLLVRPGLLGTAAAPPIPDGVGPWAALVKWTAVAVLLAAAPVARWPRPGRGGWGTSLLLLAGVTAAWGVAVVAMLRPAWSPPPLSPGEPVHVLWTAAIVQVLGVAAALGLRRAIRERHTLLGAVAALAAVTAIRLVAAVRGLPPYDAAWYADQVLLAGSFALVVLALLDEHVALLARERSAQEHLATVVQATAALVLVCDQEGRVVFLNRAAEQATGLTLDDSRGQPAERFVAPEDAPGFRGALQERARTGQPGAHETVWLTRDGLRRLIAWSSIPLTDERSGRLSVICIGIDVTARARAEQALRAGDATLRAWIETTAQGILLADRDGRIALVNAGVEQMFGYRRAELLGRPLETLVPEPLREAHARHRITAMAAPSLAPPADVYRTGRRKDGSQFPIEVSLSLVTAQDGAFLLAFVTDLTRRAGRDAPRAGAPADSAPAPAHPRTRLPV